MPFIDPVALANAEAGNALATYVVDTKGPSAMQGLKDLATDLPLIPLGRVTPMELGALTAELEGYKNSLSAISPSAPVTSTTTAGKLLDQLISLISLISQSMPSASGGLETADQAIAVVYLTQWSYGISNAVGFMSGKLAGGSAAP